MIKPPIKTVSQHKKAWINQIMDSMRETENLCFNCNHLRFPQNGLIKCHIAGQLFHMESEHHVHTVITRCPIWKQKED